MWGPSPEKSLGIANITRVYDNRMMCDMHGIKRATYMWYVTYGGIQKALIHRGIMVIAIGVYSLPGKIGQNPSCGDIMGPCGLAFTASDGGWSKTGIAPSL